MQKSIQFNGIWKKFARGEKYDSLRDLIPSMARTMFSSGGSSQLSKKEFWALKDVSFDLEPGESCAIIGPNGSGKSTALKLLSRILKPDKGRLCVRGRLGTLIELRAGFHPDLTGRENIYLSGTILGMKRSEIAKKFDAIVDFSELHEFLDTPVKRYSSGMYARLGFSVAAHVDPDVLIVDEVLSVGDFHFQQRCFDKMREFAQRGTTLLFVSHNMTAVSTLCKRALLLRKGEALFYGDTSVAIQRYHSLYEEKPVSCGVEVTHARVVDITGTERETFTPGEQLTLQVMLRATSDIRNAHASLLIHTVDGQLIFDTGTSRLVRDGKLTLKEGETASLAFTLDMNLRCGVFVLGLLITPEFESGPAIYSHESLKRIVMSGERQSNGIVHLNPRAELVAQPGRHCIPNGINSFA